jgi:predicted adenine nucleotide alpha hydrolase (AANH) superfamily ATPase
MKTAVDQFMDKILEQKLITGANNAYLLGNSFQECLDIERAQKIEMLKSFLHDLQMGEDVGDVEAWFEDYEKKQEQVKKELTSEEIPESFFKPVLCEPIWNVTNRTTKQQEQ